MRLFIIAVLAVTLAGCAPVPAGPSVNAAPIVTVAATATPDTGIIIKATLEQTILRDGNVQLAVYRVSMNAVHCVMDGDIYHYECIGTLTSSPLTLFFMVSCDRVSADCAWHQVK